MSRPSASVCAAAVAVAVLLLVALCARKAARRRAPFYTGAATEEPTRSYVPYTGTIPLGVWGTEPWAEWRAPSICGLMA